VVQQVLFNGSGLKDSELLGCLLTSLVERGALEKTLNFLTSVRDETAVFNWRMAVALSGGLKNLYFAGFMMGTDMLIIAAVNRIAQMKLYDRFVERGGIELEQSVRDRAREIRDQACRDEEFFDDFSRLNNELANLQRELHKKNVELTKLDQLKNQFLGMAAHDLRSPLVTVDMYSGYLMDGLAEKLSAEEMECLSIIRSSSTYMLDLVNDLLDISRIESGKLQLHPEEGDLCELVRHVKKLNTAVASRKKLDIHLTLDDDVPRIHFDRLRLEQVMHNLLSNAIKFSHPEGSISIGVRRKEDHILITVADRGVGIAEDERQKLFDIFEHTRPRGTEGEKGTGLGLAIVKKIVVAHGGSIWVESEAGQGTTVFVTLPIAHI
jgi:signal transduction histidine kinase